MLLRLYSLMYILTYSSSFGLVLGGDLVGARGLVLGGDQVGAHGMGRKEDFGCGCCKNIYIIIYLLLLLLSLVCEHRVVWVKTCRVGLTFCSLLSSISFSFLILISSAICCLNFLTLALSVQLEGGLCNHCK